MPENEEIAELARREFEAVKAKDVDTYIALGAKIVGGFGLRNAEFRNQPASVESITRFMENTDYLESSGFEELHTWSEGDVGIAWGIVNEEFQQKGQPQEKWKIRMTLTFIRDSEGWHQIMYHRDIQPFDSEGRYLAEHRRVQ